MKAPAFALLAAATPAFAALKEVWWNITYIQNANPDGLQPRRVIGVNGTWPWVSSYLRACTHSLTDRHSPQASASRRDDERHPRRSRHQLHRSADVPPPPWHVLQLDLLDGRRRRRLTVVRVFIAAASRVYTHLFRQRYPSGRYIRLRGSRQRVEPMGIILGPRPRLRQSLARTVSRLSSLFV